MLQHSLTLLSRPSISHQSRFLSQVALKLISVMQFAPLSHHPWYHPRQVIKYKDPSRPALVAQWANTLSCSAQCVAGWLAQHGFNYRCRHVELMSGLLDAMRSNSRRGTEGPPVSSIKCDRPSHPDWTEASGLWWEPLAWITDGRCLRLHLLYDRAAPLALCQRNPQAKLGS